MAREEFEKIIEQMKSQGIQFLDNITAEQLDQVQERYHIVFPERLRRFYMAGMPVSAGFVRWLEDSPGYIEQVQKKLKAPVKNVLSAVEIEDFWSSCWGERPGEEEQALEIAGAQLSRAADLIPLYSHRYMVCLESAEDAPVLSVYGSDIIYYGADLNNWLQIEFCGLPRKTIFESELPEIPGWQDLVG